MPEIKSYQPGMFSWADLATTDQEGAKKFYSELLGWKTVDQPMGPGATYTMAQVGGKDVAALTTQRLEESSQKVPPHWNVYFTVASADDAAAKAASIGGKVVVPAMDVMDVGRMAVIQDPSGAMFNVWQAKKHIGAGVFHAPGSLDWAELVTTNVDACGSFYQKLFGWEPKAMPMGDMTYTMFSSGEDGRAGMMPMPKDAPKGVPSHWGIYFSVDHCDKRVKLAKSLGAKELVAAMDVPTVGRFAMLFDPQGAQFSVIQPMDRPQRA